MTTAAAFVYVVTGYPINHSDGSEDMLEYGEVLGVCTTPEAAEAVRAEALTHRIYQCNCSLNLYGEVTVTEWWGHGPTLIKGRVG